MQAIAFLIIITTLQELVQPASKMRIKVSRKTEEDWKPKRQKQKEDAKVGGRGGTWVHAFPLPKGQSKSQGCLREMFWPLGAAGGKESTYRLGCYGVVFHSFPAPRDDLVEEFDVTLVFELPCADVFLRLKNNTLSYAPWAYWVKTDGVIHRTEGRASKKLTFFQNRLKYAGWLKMVFKMKKGQRNLASQKRLNSSSIVLMF